MIGPQPLGIVELSIATGLTAFGGVNGAGKTVLLGALSEALTGDLRNLYRAHLIFSMDDGPEGLNEDTAQRIVSSLSAPLIQTGSGRSEGRIKRMKPTGHSMTDVFAEAVDLIIKSRDLRKGDLPRDTDFEDLCKEIRDQHTLAVVYDVPERDGRVRVTTWLAATPHRATPRLADEWGTARGEWERRVEQVRHQPTGIAAKQNAAKQLIPDVFEEWQPEETNNQFLFNGENELPVPVLGRFGPWRPPMASSRLTQVAPLFEVETLRPTEDPDRDTVAALVELHTARLAIQREQRENFRGTKANDRGSELLLFEALGKDDQSKMSQTVKELADW